MFADEADVWDIRGKKDGMDGRLLTPEMKMAEVIEENYRLLRLLPRFGMGLGFGDCTAREWCEREGVSWRLFMMICNVYHREEYLPGEEELGEVEAGELVAYLERSHAYYLEQRLRAMEGRLEKVSATLPEGHGEVLGRFFRGYKEEVVRHFDYEERTVFPYIRDVTVGPPPGGYRIEVFRENHSNIDDKLNDLKNIIMKYLRGKQLGEEKIDLLFDIFSLEEDLAKHALIEDRILVPLVLKLEEGYEGGK